jgi:hypothetical protein
MLFPDSEQKDHGDIIAKYQPQGTLGDNGLHSTVIIKIGENLKNRN